MDSNKGRETEMNMFDNAKLVGFIQEHSVEVVEVTPFQIHCVTLFGDGSKVVEVVEANMPAVRAYLGY